MPKISTVLPIYNSEEFIRECMDSLLAQTFKDFEILAIYDNGTTDNTPCILEEYKKKDHRVKPIDIGENRGLVQALNYGISISKGEYIARMDADDVCMNNRFERQIEYFENNNVHILSSGIIVYGDCDEKKSFEIEKWFNDLKFNENLEKLFLDKCPIVHPTVMIKKEVFEKLEGYNDKFTECEDYDLWLRAVKAGFKIKYLNEKLLKYRIVNNSKSSKASNLIKYNVLAKLNYLQLENKVRDLKYIIWGASNGGKNAKTALERFVPYGKLVAFIDKYKSGYIDGVKIYHPSNIGDLEFDYIFIATTPGKNETETFLTMKKFEFVKDFVYII